MFLFENKHWKLYNIYNTGIVKKTLKLLHFITKDPKLLILYVLLIIFYCFNPWKCVSYEYALSVRKPGVIIVLSCCTVLNKPLFLHYSVRTKKVLWFLMSKWSTRFCFKGFCPFITCSAFGIFIVTFFLLKWKWFEPFLTQSKHIVAWNCVNLRFLSSLKK